ncbi:sulfurtransferase [Streptomyces albofaciens JCM 4342]|uniref:sulfurtransferase n=1 Tax=Streptomyces albofaciens TaxID=66866 RepID=UPI00123BF6AB|nr:sulfurtransferase [Streptomyces albofaciens]KAA6213524.1 sulfurtransferase [Streptomyces albofaciens JCM 4342]
MNPLITAAELAEELASGTPPVLLDVRYRLGGPPGRPEYEAGHVPGAVYVDMDAELAGPAGPAGRHPLPDLDAFAETMRRAGVSGNRPVVVYDGGLEAPPGRSSGGGWSAARAWWMLRYTGHPSVRVLDGGLAAWTASGGALSTDVPSPEPGDFAAVPGALPLLTADEAAALARRGVLLDARAGERYRGEVEPIDRVAGHIPGALSAPTTDNLTADGTFRPSAELADRFSALGATPDAEVGVYCGSGVSAAQEVLALAIAGVPAALYVGSWSEWSADPTRPVATGAQPG